MAEDGKGAFPGDGADATAMRIPDKLASSQVCPVFAAPAMVAQTGASMVKGGRRLSGRVCHNWKGRGACAFGDACRFLHPAPPSRASPDASSVPPLGYLAHKAQQQLGADPSRSLLAEVLESSGLFRRVADPSLCALLWAQSFTTGALYDALPDGAFVNHFPNSVAITHKHRLVLSLRSVPGGEAVAPEGFLLPAESEAFLRADAASDDADADRSPSPTRSDRSDAATRAARRSGERHKRPIRWIVKRSVGGEGRGIAVRADAAAALAYVAGDAKSRVVPTSLPVAGKEDSNPNPNPTRFRKKDGDDPRLVTGASHIVQRYVPRPLLVFGRKVDLRAYALVTSWGGAEADAPVRAFLYAEGLVRFAAAPYDAHDADEKRHLTNNALATAREHQSLSAQSGFVTKNASKNASSSKESDGDGASARAAREGPDAEAHFKRNWSFERFGAFLDDTRGAGSFADVWARVRNAARVALEAASPAVRLGLKASSSRGVAKTQKRRRHFELLGLDVLVDEELRVWLLEVNSAPSLVAGTRRRGRVSETHQKLKGGLIADAMHLLDAGRAARGDTEATTEAEEAANELERARSGGFVSLYG